MADPALPNSSIYMLPQPLNCGDDHICTTDIETLITISGVMIPFLIGSRKFMNMTVVIINHKEPASLVKAKIIYPKITPLRSIPQVCQDYTKSGSKFISSLLVCDISNLMAKKERRRIHLSFDMKNITSNQEKLVYKIITTSAGEDLHPENNDKELVIPLQTISDVSIAGKSYQESVYFYKNNYTLQDIIPFKHVYEAYTLGPSPLNLARFIFKVPTSVETSSGRKEFLKVYHPQTYNGYPSLMCSTEHDSSDDSNFLPFENHTNENHHVKVENTRNSEHQMMMENYHGKARKKRQLEYIEEEEEEDGNIQLSPLPLSQAFHADCTKPTFKCTILYCVVGPMHVTVTRAVITIPMELYPAIAEKLLDGKDLMILHSFGAITAEEIPSLYQPAIHEPDYVNVSTAFFAKYEEAEFDIWILLVTISGGIMALFLIILVLFKAGFFERHKKRELEMLKLRLKISANPKPALKISRSCCLERPLCPPAEKILNPPLVGSTTRDGLG
ncbi:integrin alpha-V-like [Ischnura elegans]|uniref:integrin alpha-V-like n=1 Tax=Ischnura elegans TaxID=197161 RepID=UPI001ED8BCE0|nr:integrin alpha-V-like [Ischnura elegans]